jgi:uncharacterized protein YgiM (DUF1202 family)
MSDMSDDFDNLRPKGDEGDDDDFPDWLSDEPETSGKPASGDSLGFTGELTWRKELEDAFDQQLDQADDDSPDWQKERPSSGGAPASGGFGFTGELDWKQTGLGGDEESPAEAEPAGWMSDDLFDDQPEASSQQPEIEDDPFALPPVEASIDDDPFALPPAEPSDADDQLSWLQQYSASDEPEAPAQQPSGGAEMPSWLDEVESETPAEESLPDDAPPWLQAADEPEKLMTESGKLSADWLAGAEHAPETASSDLTFDQWQNIQDSVTRQRDSDEEMPDLFSELGGDIASNDLPTTDTGELPSWVLGMDELDNSQAPDWFTGDEQAAPETPPAPAEPVDIFAELGISQDAAPKQPADDIFGELGLDSPETGYDFLDNPPAAEEDLLAGLDLGQPTDSSTDWFSGAEAEAPAVKDSPDWLQDLGDLSSIEPAVPDAAAAASFDPDEFFGGLPDLGDDEGLQPADINPLHTPGLQDIDSLLATYDVERQLPSTGELVMGTGDIDQIFSQNEMDEIGVRRSGESRPTGITGLSPDAPDWLTELGANVDEVSAAAIVRKQTQKEKSLDDLSDRLFALHEQGLELPTSEDVSSNDVLKSILPGVNEVLPSTPLRTTAPTERTGDLVLSDAQRQKINLLRTLVGTEQIDRRPKRAPSAIDLTLTSPNLDDMGVLDDLDDVAEPDSQPTPVSRVPRRRRGPKIDRLLIALIMTIAVVLPFVFSPLRIGDLPPAQFALGSRQQAVFNQVEAVGRGDLVLVAAEYGPTGAAELDSALDALLRHILIRGARPVIVSGNPVGLLHARNILDGIATEPAFLAATDRPQIQSGRDYFVVRYLAAGTIGLRAFSEDIPRLLAVDVSGAATGLEIQSLRDFELIVLIAESAEEVRGWAEQVAPLAGKALVAVTSQSAAPLAEPYVMPEAPERLPGLSGLLVGYKDAYTYRSMLDARLFPSASVTEPPPTETPTTPPPTRTPIPTAESTDEAGGGLLAGASESPEATITQETAATPTTAPPTNTVAPTATDDATTAPTSPPTNTVPPTRTPVPSSTPTVTPGPVIRAVVDSGQAVNVREGPGRNFAPIGSVTPGTIVQVIGRSGDGSWIQVRLDDGREGWMSADLLAIEAPEASSAEGSPTPESSARDLDGDFMMVALISDVQPFPLLAQVDETPEATVEATEEAAAEATIEATVAPADTDTTASALPSSTTYRDERWYGMTLGLVAIILIITLGTIINILRGLFRRRTR